MHNELIVRALFAASGVVFTYMITRYLAKGDNATEKLSQQSERREQEILNAISRIDEKIDQFTQKTAVYEQKVKSLEKQVERQEVELSTMKDTIIIQLLNLINKLEKS